MTNKLVVSFEESKYTYMKHRIYRKDVIGGTIWAVCVQGIWYISDNLDLTRQLIKKIQSGVELSKWEKQSQVGNVPIITAGYFDTFAGVGQGVR